MKPIYKFLVSVCIVLAGVIAMDFCMDKVLFKLMQELPNDGRETSRTYHSLYSTDTPLVIVGSSRAIHHYIPSMIEDSLHIGTYNIGKPGCFLRYNCCINSNIMDRYTPKFIIWECGILDLLNDNRNRLESLYPFYRRNNTVTQIIDESESTKRRIQLQSNMYKYNSTALRLITRSMIRNTYNDPHKGYLPIKPTALKKPLSLEYDTIPQLSIDSLKIKQFHRTIEQITSKGTQLFVFFSPVYQLIDSAQNNPSIEIMKDICEKYNIPVFDNLQIQEFLEHPEYFKDATHLNDIGAKKYTEIVIEQIRPYIQE